ncbi:hypothetical protein GCM10011344_40300 [Dokdonia pacifica]|uniref:Uncharacterized protein n=1 Tax=Dokdonia pacifica TaxID=1627892 RepID=A0A239A952_9FLAO|nr:hypothetical protein [Dokdonia pacifica]GGG35393.1 hypothetical protein GCM10011344_40300 [Dokdonia pacifica]SNR91618.1 hypothetical protein SAMN06265376_104211 [Dokdonia pacifica]
MQDIPQASEQYQGLTSSSDGKNVMPRLQPISHFFLEGDNFSQTESQKFGPISASVFNTTSRVTFTGSKKIYAICQGTVFIQPQTGNADKVNVLLKPYKQPINGLSIKYFIYRGLNKNDFVNGLQVAPKGSNATGFVNYIWDEFESFHDVEDGETAPSFLAKYIGFPENEIDQEVSGYIDQFFYKIATYTEGETPQENPEGAYELPIISRGTHLGNATESIGLDIILNIGDYYIENDPNPFKLDLTFARVEDGKLETTGIPEGFQTKLLKEACTQFIDPAAFYGTHANGIGKLFIDEVENPITTKEQIASKLNGFLTKNTIYLYIQGERRRSYNFYNNYQYSEDNTNDIKIGADAESLQETQFRTLGWPVEVIESGEYLNPDTGTIAMQLVTDGNEEAILYTEKGVLLSGNTNNFVQKENLIPEVTLDPTETVEEKYTKTVLYGLPKDNNNRIICNWLSLNYKGKSHYIIGSSDAEQRFYPLKEIDQLYNLLNVNSFISLDNSFASVLDKRIITQHFETNKLIEVGTVVSRRIEDIISNDESVVRRVTFESVLVDVNRDTQSFYKTGSPLKESLVDNINQNDSNQNNIYTPQIPYYIDTIHFSDGSNVINGLLLESQDRKRPMKYVVGLSYEEWMQIQSLISENSLTNASLFFDDTLYLDTDTYTSEEEYLFKKYNLGVIGEGIEGELIYYLPSEVITIYTIDQLFHFSESYSKHVESLNTYSEDLYFLDIIPG